MCRKLKEPWRVEQNSNDYDIIRGNERIAGYIQSKSTANLMAAAPELRLSLEAMVMAVRLYQQLHPGDRLAAADVAQALLTRLSQPVEA